MLMTLPASIILVATIVVPIYTNIHDIALELGKNTLKVEGRETSWTLLWYHEWLNYRSLNTLESCSYIMMHVFVIGCMYRAMFLPLFDILKLAALKLALVSQCHAQVFCLFFCNAIWEVRVERVV